MNKQTLILMIVGFVLFLTPALAENPNFCHYSFKDLGNIEAKVVVEKEKADEFPKLVWVTAYSSTPEETDDTPFITASMTTVRDGIVAANFLPFGTKIMIPELFGDKIFVVEDRMHRRNHSSVDIWMPSKEAAKEFGITKTKIVIVEG